jgi:hypothetical protein
MTIRYYTEDSRIFVEKKKYMKRVKKVMFLYLCFVSVFGMAQIEFLRTIEKSPKSDTIAIHFKLQKFQPDEICRIQQKVPSSFNLINQLGIADTAYFEKDIATAIWTSTPKDSVISYTLFLKAPEQSNGYLYIGDCACMYGGKKSKLERKYLPKERINIIDSTLIPQTDTLIFCQIDSIHNKAITDKKVTKNHRNRKLATKDNYFFRIQITASKFKQDLKDISKEAIAPDITYEEQQDQLYKYTIGNYKTYKIAQDRMQLYRKQKNLNSYIVAYKNGKRMGVKEVNNEIKQTEEE